MTAGQDAHRRWRGWLVAMAWTGCLWGSLPAAADVVHDADVAAMVDGVTIDELAPAVEELSGARPALVGGVAYTFETRSAFSGEAIDKAEQYVFEHLQSYGLDSVVYHEFPGEDGAPPGRNIIGQINGTTKAGEIVVVGAHLDSFPWEGKAPGADDDASGVSATLYLARAFAGKTFERTIRFAFFGDEENAPWECQEIGSAGYAAKCKAAGENIVAMIEADSIAFDPPETDEPIVEMNTRMPGDDPDGADLAIFELWAEAIDVYSIADLVPVNVAISNNWSDHGSFWNNGYPAVMLVAEELENWNPYWHTGEDTVDKLDWPFYVQVTKSYVAVAAHLAGIVPVPPIEGDAAVEEPDAGTQEPDAGAHKPDAGAHKPDAGAAESDGAAEEMVDGAVAGGGAGRGCAGFGSADSNAAVILLLLGLAIAGHRCARKA
ncbi:MAG: M20/M25/M40 family metallo-hydrolase [Deltaproteobacteria bacterium]|nr:M20/M25/M40 family metallo-hydrolase [Deltaproteobacteria bacterium]